MDPRRYSNDAWQRELGRLADANKKQNFGGGGGGGSGNGGGGIGIIVLAGVIFIAVSSNDDNPAVNSSDTKLPVHNAQGRKINDAEYPAIAVGIEIQTSGKQLGKDFAVEELGRIAYGSNEKEARELVCEDRYFCLPRKSVPEGNPACVIYFSEEFRLQTNFHYSFTSNSFREFCTSINKPRSFRNCMDNARKICNYTME